ncbi:hypothetical protein CLTEP_18160 [Clostridium tepidiprofundi DSM 19306]|uniref:Uncharacterized protein n=1 Tax=Clostridium tepidiprofundi DSM 19306 TaxID=1121338 RepID=A0A151B2V3_9CLOT|nr:hypothetical protein [Clostridium tepidiprofundi]KYH34241.1 hypothetical protein CLTEP_18160 [Clostridium tepidiprofundi DSM 19306]
MRICAIKTPSNNVHTRNFCNQPQNKSQKGHSNERSVKLELSALKPQDNVIKNLMKQKLSLQ